MINEVGAFITSTLTASKGHMTTTVTPSGWDFYNSQPCYSNHTPLSYQRYVHLSTFVEAVYFYAPLMATAPVNMLIEHILSNSVCSVGLHTCTLCTKQSLLHARAQQKCTKGYWHEKYIFLPRKEYHTTLGHTQVVIHFRMTQEMEHQEQLSDTI